MAASITISPPGLSIPSHRSSSSLALFPHRSSPKSIVSALSSPYGDLSTVGLSSKTSRQYLSLNKADVRAVASQSYTPIVAAQGDNPTLTPAVMTPEGPMDISTVLFRSRTIFIGQLRKPQVAQRIISQLVTLAAIDENADILVYINTSEADPYNVLAIYDCMSWIKPKVGTICFGAAASHGALLLAGGEKGMRYAMPNSRIMIHQPVGGSGGHVEDVRRQVDESSQLRNKFDRMYAAFTGQPLETIQVLTNRDKFMSAAEALELGLIDGLLETEY